MKSKLLVVCLAASGIIGLSGEASAQLKYGKDYTTSDGVSSVTTVKVDANMIGHYLEGIKQTWVTGNQVAKDLGQIDSWDIYLSELPDSGDFNVALIVRFKDMAQYEKGRTEYAAFEEAWLKKISEEKREGIVKTYPGIRKIAGEYLLRKVELK
jgi:hypothetical protein